MPIWFLNSCGTVLWERKLAWQNYQKNWQVYAKTPKMLSESFVTINYVCTLRGSCKSPQRHQRFANHKEKTLLKQSHTSRPTGSNPPDAKSMWLDTTGGKTHSRSNYTAHEHSCHLSLLHKPRLTRVIVGKSDRL